MENKDILGFFGCLGEIWRDITIIEFLMRCAIAKYDGEIDKFPKPPYTKGKYYKNPPKSFRHLSFEIITTKFNKRYPNIAIPTELIQLRDAMAHGIITEINNSGTNQLIKFKELKNGKEKGLQIEFILTLEADRLEKIRQSLGGVRRIIMKEIDEK